MKGITMKINMYSIYDKVAEEFAQPFLAKNDGIATRAYMQGVRNVENPKDYELVQIGEFENSEALLIPFNVPRDVILKNEMEGV